MSDAALARCHDSYLDALRAGDRRRALAVVGEACDAGFDLPRVYLHVFQPALREIGRLWEANQITVADEHLATAVTQIAMGRLYAEACMRVVPKGPTLVAGCVETERHELGLRMVCDLLELDGWDATFLGATVPEQSLITMIRDRRPDVVALSVSTELCLPALRATVKSLREATTGATPYIVVGGRPFHEHQALAAQVGADATAHDASAAVAMLRERFQ